MSKQDIATLEINADLIRNDKEIIKEIQDMKSSNKAFEVVFKEINEYLIPHIDNDRLVKVAFDNCESEVNLIKAIGAFLDQNNAQLMVTKSNPTLQIVSHCLIVVQYLTKTAKGNFVSLF